MNKISAAATVFLLATTLAACDRRDSEDDASPTPADTTVSDAAPADATATATDASGPADAGATDGTAAANGMTDANASGTLPAGTTAAATPALTPAGTADTEFYRQALISGVGEVALSEHAARTSSSAEVKRIAQMLVKDHGELNGSLRTTSGMGDVAPPDAEAKAAQDIKAMNGAAFDAAYLQKMSDGHAKSIERYQSAASGAASAETRALATAALPKIRTHAGHVDKALAALPKKTP